MTVSKKTIPLGIARVLTAAFTVVTLYSPLLGWFGLNSLGAWLGWGALALLSIAGQIGIWEALSVELSDSGTSKWVFLKGRIELAWAEVTSVEQDRKFIVRNNITEIVIEFNHFKSPHDAYDFVVQHLSKRFRLVDGVWLPSAKT